MSGSTRERRRSSFPIFLLLCGFLVLETLDSLVKYILFFLLLRLFVFLIAFGLIAVIYYSLSRS